MTQQVEKAAIFDKPAYPASEAAYILNLPLATVKAWSFGQTRRDDGRVSFKAVIRAADARKHCRALSVPPPHPSPACGRGGAQAHFASFTLMGNFPEFNSLTVVGIVSAIEEQTGSSVDDNEIAAEIFETVGTLADFIESKLA